MSPNRLPRTISTDRLVLLATGLVVLAAVGIAGWSVAFSAAGETPTVERDVSERYDDIESLNATRTTVIERNGTVASTTVYDATLVPATDRQRLRLVGDAPGRYDLRVANGSALWLHDTDAATVTEIPLTGPPDDADTGGRIERLLVRAGLVGDERASGTTPTVEPLPVVPSSPGGSVAPAANYAVEYTGTETVDGRDAYVVTVTARANSSTAYRQTLWIDAEWFYPLQRQTVWTDDGTRTRLTTTYANVSVNPSLPNGTFRPEIGPNTTVETVETPDTETYRQLSALRAAANMTVPEPDIPPSYELTYATHTTGQIRGVDLQFVNRTSRITVSKYNFTYPEEGSRTVAGRPATLSEGPTTSLSWSCDVYRYTVRGAGVTTDQLVSVAESVGCPGG